MIRLAFLFVLLSSQWAFAQNARDQKIWEAHEFENLAGEQKSLAEILQQYEGKVVYVDFWASWCGPCKKEMHAARSLKADFTKEEVVFLYLSIDEKSKAWRRAIEHLDVRGAHYRIAQSEAKDLLLHYSIYAIPHYWLIRSNGRFFSIDAPYPSEARAARALQRLLKSAK